MLSSNGSKLLNLRWNLKVSKSKLKPSKSKLLHKNELKNSKVREGGLDIWYIYKNIIINQTKKIFIIYYHWMIQSLSLCFWVPNCSSIIKDLDYCSFYYIWRNSYYFCNSESVYYYFNNSKLVRLLLDFTTNTDSLFFLISLSSLNVVYEDSILDPDISLNNLAIVYYYFDADA